MNEIPPVDAQPEPDYSELLERVVAARDKFGAALLLSVTDSKGKVQIPIAEMFIVQRIEKMKLKCLMEAMDAGELSTNAVLKRFIAELEQAIAELLKPQIALDVGRALDRKRWGRD